MPLVHLTPHQRLQKQFDLFTDLLTEEDKECLNNDVSLAMEYDIIPDRESKDVAVPVLLCVPERMVPLRTLFSLIQIYDQERHHLMNLKPELLIDTIKTSQEHPYLLFNVRTDMHMEHQVRLKTISGLEVFDSNLTLRETFFLIQQYPELLQYYIRGMHVGATRYQDATQRGRYINIYRFDDKPLSYFEAAVEKKPQYSTAWVCPYATSLCPSTYSLQQKKTKKTVS